MAVVTGSIASAVGTIGAVAGGVKAAKSAFGGGRGDTTVNQTTVAPKSAQEKALERDSLSNYRRQQELAAQGEQGIDAASSMQDPAIQAYLSQISGEAFNPNEQELQRIQTLRDAMVNQGSADVNRFLEQGLQQATSGAAARGLRGGALGSLRGGVVQEGARQIGDIANQANVFAANQAINQPYQRVAAQQNALQTGLTYGDMLRQQAVQNRQQLQNPVLMQSLRDQRLAGRGSQQYTQTPAGGLMGGILGGIGGVAQGLEAGTNLYKGVQDLRQLGQTQTPINNLDPRRAAQATGFNPNAGSYSMGYGTSGGMV